MKRKILNNKYYLYMTEFFSGMAVMAVELGASRLLAPYFSSSQIVWTIIIGTIMIAMALGNLYGGRSADKNPNPDVLYRRLIIAAIWIAAIPVLGKYVIILIAGALVITVNTGFLVAAAFLACMVIFVYPLFLLGTVTPSLVKYTVESLDESGTTVGTLGAFNTIGSILGTFLPTFVTIPAVGTAVTFLLFSGVLLVLGLVYFLSGGTGKRLCATAAILFIACSIFGNSDSFAFWEKGLTYEGESIYNYLQVKESEDRIVLSTNVLFGVQSVKMKSGSLTGMYYDVALAAPLMAGLQPGATASGAEAAGPAVLILGNGTGTYATQCQKYFPGTKVEGVEIDPSITELAGEYFSLDPAVEVVTYDGRAYLDEIDRKYDVIMVDAYQDITIPFQMASKEFFSSVRKHLKDSGVMVVNMNMKTDTEGGINEWLADTIATEFSFIYTADVPGWTNRELFAGNDPAMLTNLQGYLRQNGELAEQRQESEAGGQMQEGELAEQMQIVAGKLQPYQAGDRILTDDRAPVELLSMRAIDKLIADELGHYKKVFREKGLAGLMEEL